MTPGNDVYIVCRSRQGVADWGRVRPVSGRGRRRPCPCEVGWVGPHGSL